LSIFFGGEQETIFHYRLSSSLRGIEIETSKMILKGTNVGSIYTSDLKRQNS
jgi:uridylate kinase